MGGESPLLKMKLNEYLFCNLYCLVLIREETPEEKNNKNNILFCLVPVGEYFKSLNALIQTVCMNRKNTSIIRVVCSMEMIVQLPKNSMMPTCSVWKQSKVGWQPVSHEIDDPCLKSIIVSKPKIHLMTINFSRNTQD